MNNTEKNLVYIPKIVTNECFACKKIFELYEVQNVGIVFCKQCTFNSKLIELTTLPKVFKQIVFFAEQQNQKIDDRLVVDISKLFEELQKN